MTEEIITLMSLNDLAEANIIKTKLETKGIVCFMNNKRQSFPEKTTAAKKDIDIKVYMKDLDKALQLIGEDYTEEGK